MKTLDEEHKELITKCYDNGHTWGEWENEKYTSDASRTCGVCKLYTNLGAKGTSKAYAIGSTWERADVAIPFINSLAYKSRI